MGPADLIDESVLADARMFDRFVREHGPDLPSIEGTLRIIRDVDPDTFRRVGRDVWGAGGSDGADLVGGSFNACIDQLDDAINQASSWTGQARNAYGERLNATKSALNNMRKPSQDVGRALEDIADSYEVKFSDVFNNILSIIGGAVAAIGLVVAIVVGVVAGWTGVGAIVSLVIAIISLLVAVAAIWYAMHVKAEEKIATLGEASETSSRVIERADPPSVALRKRRRAGGTMGADDRLVQAKERLARIKQDPERALFSDFKGVSPGGMVTVWVDVLGRMSRIHFAPNSLREGAEPWLIDEVMSAYSSARSSADLLDFDLAELARELDGALRLRDEVLSKPAPHRREPESPGRSRGDDDDDDWFGQQSVLR